MVKRFKNRGKNQGSCQDSNTCSLSDLHWVKTYEVYVSMLPSVKWGLVEASGSGHDAILGIRLIFLP